MFSTRLKTATARRTSRRHCRPRLEGLEDRRLLSTLTVMNNADNGDGSLRAVIAAAHSGDTIVFDNGLNGQTITLTSGELVVDKSLAIKGPGADQLAISGNSASRVIEITNGAADVLICGLTVEDGSATRGGGIYDAGASVSLTHCVLNNDQAVGAPG